MNPFMQRLIRRREELDEAAQAILARAGEEDRDMTENEADILARHHQDIEKIDKDMEPLVRAEERNAKAAETVANLPVRRSATTVVVHPTDREPEVLFRTAGEYVATVVEAGRGDHEARARMDRAIQNQVLADNPGIVPTPILGPVVTFANQLRPAIEASTKRAMPGSGATFSRPKVTQHSLVGAQAAEKTEVPSRNLKIDPINVVKKTFGGVLDISFQNRDWTDPALLDIAISDLAASYAAATDQDFCTTFTAAVTQTQAVDDYTAAAWVSAIFAAVGGMILPATNNMFADTVWTSTDVWAALGSLSDSTGRPIFPNVNPINTIGSMTATSYTANVMGLKLAVDARFPAGTAIIGPSMLVEFYEQVGGQLSVVEPSILGFQIAYYGYVASCVVEPNAFVKLTGGLTP